MGLRELVRRFADTFELRATDTVPLGRGSPKLAVLSNAPLLADTIEAMFARRSVSTIFAGQEAF